MPMWPRKFKNALLRSEEKVEVGKAILTYTLTDHTTFTREIVGDAHDIGGTFVFDAENRVKQYLERNQQRGFVFNGTKYIPNHRVETLDIRYEKFQDTVQP